MTDYGVTNTGFVRKDYETVLADEIARLQNYFGSNVDLSPTNPLYQLIQVQALEKAELWEQIEHVYYTGFVNFAEGVNLDEVVVMLGFTRIAATFATGQVTFSRATPYSTDITIPVGTRVSTGDGAVMFETTAVGTLVAGNTSVIVAARAITAGTLGNVAGSTITVIVDTLANIETVTNAATFGYGTNQESDAALRHRVATYAPGARATLLAIYNTIMAVAGVSACLVTENTTAHTITATVLGGTDNAVNAAILDSRPAGISCSLARPTEKIVVVTAAVTKASGAVTGTVQTNILSALNTYFAGLTIDSDILFSQVADAIMNANGVAVLTSLSITQGATTITTFGSSITIGTTEVAIQGTHSITVS